MNLLEAYKTLNVTQNISDADLKKKYRDLAKQKHPDKGGDPDEFKRINEAYQFINDARQKPHEFAFETSSFVNIDDFMSGFPMGGGPPSASRGASDITLDVNLSFEESILGTSKEVEYDRQIECDKCGGAGEHRRGNGCNECDGFGRIIHQSAGFVTHQSCRKCFGAGIKRDVCKNCNSKGAISHHSRVTVDIPPGIDGGNILRIQGQGNYAGSSFLGSRYTSVMLNIHVTKHKFFTRKGNDVISYLSLSLLESLKGKDAQVDTVYGTREIIIPALSKNNQEISIPALGVQGTPGAHRVILDVNYPSDTEKLVEFLKNAE